MKEYIKSRLEALVSELFGLNLPPAKIEKPRNESLGDLASNVSFLIAKELKKNPQDIAQTIAKTLCKDDAFEEVTPVKGFLNFKFSEGFLLREFENLLKLGEDFFKEDLGKEERLQIEFVSANPTGPLHLGHGRGAVVGDVLARVLSFFGYKITREYYVNDTGRQVYLLGVSILYRYLQLSGSDCSDLKGVFEKEGYKGEYILEIASLLREHVGDLLLSSEGVLKARDILLSACFPFPLNYTALFKPFKDPQIELCSVFGLDFLMGEIRKDLSSLGVSFDIWFSERKLYEKRDVDKLLKNLKDFLYEKEGALWLRTSAFGDDKDRVLRKSDGTYTYFASDIAYHRNKYLRGFKKVINLWGADHHGYIPRVRAALKMLKIPEDWLEIYLIQMVRLFKEGREIKMSKRAGNFVTLRELIEEVGPDAVRFVFLTKRSDTPLDFDVDKVKEKSSENPVFYVQYAHARISGIFREFKNKWKVDPEEENFLPFLKYLNAEDEIKLIKKVLLMKDELKEAALSREPHIITYLLIDLASSFHSFYNRYRIVSGNREITSARIALLKGIRTALRLGLKLIGVSAPEKM